MGMFFLPLALVGFCLRTVCEKGGGMGQTAVTLELGLLIEAGWKEDLKKDPKLV
jgi:hypothetical protein